MIIAQLDTIHVAASEAYSQCGIDRRVRSLEFLRGLSGLAHEAHHEPTAPTAAVTAEENSFLTENDVAMTKMMNDMAVKPSGDIDHDFVAMMTPHHQGAIDMAVLQLRYGKNEQLRRIAQEIIVDQMQEIAVMKLAIGE